MKRTDYINWDEYFMGIALLTAMRSKDPSSQVGACIVSPENKILSLGYNGMPIGCNFEAAAGAGGGLLKDEGDVLAAQSVVADTGLFLGLQVGGEIQQALDLVGGVIKELQKAAVRKIHCIYSPLFAK